MIKLSLSYNALLLSVFLAISTATSPAAIASPSLADYATPEAISMMAISPNGELIAFRKKTTDKDMLIVYSLKRPNLSPD